MAPPCFSAITCSGSAGITLGQLEVFCSNPEHLLERYAEAYDDDPLLQGRLFEDLSRIERWMGSRTSHTLKLFDP